MQSSVAQRCTAGGRIWLHVSPRSSHLEHSYLKLVFYLTTILCAAVSRDQSLPSGLLPGPVMGCHVPGHSAWPGGGGCACPLLVTSAALGTPSKPLPVGRPSPLAWTGETLKWLFQFLANNLEAKSSPVCVPCSTAGPTISLLPWTPPPPGISPPLRPPALQPPAAPSCGDSMLL